MAPHVKRAYAPKPWRGRATSAALALSLCAGTLSLCAGTAAAAPPEIRTSAKNVVPACVTPQRLMSFLKSRNPNLDARFANIANLYKHHGERWHVRWDYAFYQMAVETNFLSYKQGNGRWGDVDPKQNNFAGLGTTGGGIPGDSYPDVNTGVLAQIQHLVAYSGEHVADPVGARTKLKQDDIIEQMARLKGHVTFNDLSRRWAVDRHYGAAIEWVAGNYRAVYCKPGMQRAETEADQTGAASAPVPVAKPVVALARAEALGGPTDVAEATPEPAADASAEPAAVVAAEAPEPATESEAMAPETTAAVAPVRTIWSRDKQQEPASAPQTSTDATPAADVAGAKPAPTGKTKATQRIAPLPVAKATLVPTSPVVVAAAETPPAARATTDPAPTPIASHVPEELPVEEPKPAVVAMPATAAIDAAPATPPALAVPLDVRAFTFAPALNLAELTPSQQPKPAAATGACRVLAASYGGKKTLLVRTQTGAETHYTALTVLDGFEASMFDNFVKAHAPGGASIGEYETKDAALAKAKELCPGSAAAPKVEGASAG